MTSYLLVTALRSKGLDQNGRSIPVGAATALDSEVLEVGGTIEEGEVTSETATGFNHPEFTVFELTNLGSQTAGEETGKALYVTLMTDPSDVPSQPTTDGTNARMAIPLYATRQVHSDAFGQVVVAIEADLTPS